MAKRGPRTPAGRQRASLNAITHGILARAPVVQGIESEAEWLAHHQGIIESLQPATALEANLAGRIAQADWRLRRTEVYEAELLSIAQERAEELAATAILYPQAGDSASHAAVSLHGTSAVALIHARVQELQRLSGLLHRLLERPPGWQQFAPQDLRLLIEGLALTLHSPAGVEAGLSRHVLQQLTEDREDAARTRTAAENVYALLRELDEIVASTPEAATSPSPPNETGLDDDVSSSFSPSPKSERGLGGEVSSNDSPSPPPGRRPGGGALDFLQRFPAALVLIPVTAELERLEAELLDLDATIERVRRRSLLLDEAALNAVIRYEAHLRRHLTQLLHELQALQATRIGQPAPLARLDVQLTR